MSAGHAAAWTRKTAAAIRAAAGDETADRLEATWRQHADRTRPEVTLFGPYDSGKSSLLKRLLVDAGADVPAWLTVSARRETFEVNEVEAAGWSFTDTPGVAGGDARHQELARDALALSDAFLVVVPPQLMTSDRDELLDVLSGRFYAPDRGWRYAPGAMRVVIARMDEAGVDPTEDPDAFREAATAKQTELGEILAANAIDRASVAVSVVAADPFGAVGSRPRPAPPDYDVGRDWDGVAELADALQAAASDWNALRADAHVRFLLYAGHQVRETVERELGGVRTAIEELASIAGHRARCDEELDELVRGARADLDLRVDEALRPLVTLGASGGELGVALQRSLNSVLVAWQARWDAALAQLAHTELEEISRLVGRPAAVALTGPIDLPAAPSGREVGDGARLRDSLSLAAPHLRTVWTSVIELQLGTSIEQAQRQLARLDEIRDGVGNYAIVVGFSSFEEAERTRRYVVASESGGELLEAIGALAEVAGTLGEILEDRTRRRKALEREREIRDRARSEAQRMVGLFLSGSEADGVEGWLAGVERVRGHVRERLPVDKSVVVALEEHERELLAVQAQLSALLVAAPEPGMATSGTVQASGM